MFLNKNVYVLLVVFLGYLAAQKEDDDNEVLSTTLQPDVEDDNENKENEPTLETTNPLIVTISTGKIEGFEARTKYENITYFSFQGIPYAQPPVGELRFNDPVPANEWNDTLPAFEEGRKCVQNVLVIGSEDCLYINVYTPKVRNISSNDKTDSVDQLLPVMVWIYGGFFYNGQASAHKFGPDYFIDDGVIVVSFNYRVGVFGFLSTEDYAATGNWGLKDQVLALRWVQENIRQFGGDPTNVTLFGESAGAACVSYLVQSALSRGLFHRAIMQSGTSLNSWAHAWNPRKSAFTIGKLLDIQTNDSRILVKQLRKVDYRTLHVVSTSTDLGETILHNPLDGLIFAPSTEVYHPGAVITNKSHDILKNGDFNRIPVIVGFNSKEGLPFVNVLEYLKPYVFTYDLFSTRLVPGSLNINSNILRVILARFIRNEYFGLRPIAFSNDRLVQFVTDDQFARPIYEYVMQSSKYAPTYFYIFSYEGALGINGKLRESNGVGHGEDIHYLWHRDDNINNAPNEDIVTRRRLVRLWTNFAKTSNPTPIADSLLQNVTWAPANIKAMMYLNINTSLVLESDFSTYHIKFWDQIFLRYGKPPYDTY